MPKISQPSRLRTEDFPSEQQPIIQKIASGINSFQDDVTDLINNGKLDFDNLNRQKHEFDVFTDATGKMQSPIPLKLKLRTKPYGIHIVRVLNVNDPGTLPDYMPLIDFTFNDTILTITRINGLTNNAKYRLYVEIIGT